MLENNMIFDRIRGALYGVAVGDALGGPLEFKSAEEIRRYHGRVKDMIGGGWLNLKPGEVTDDTQMTMAVARGIAKTPDNPVPEIGKNFIEWFESKPKDIGGTCYSAIFTAIIGKVESSEGWLDVGKIVASGNEMNGGNGALMRTIYPAVFYADPEQRKTWVEAIGSMTHYNDESNAICVEYSDMVHRAIFGGQPLNIEETAFYKKDAAPTGYVVDSWSNVLESIYSTSTFEDAVVEAVNRGGDADTIGAITGGLAGACYGYKNIPERWVEALDPELRKEIEELTLLAYKSNSDYYHNKC